jgi:hypothetical protein
MFGDEPDGDTQATEGARHHTGSAFKPLSIFRRRRVSTRASSRSAFASAE